MLFSRRTKHDDAPKLSVVEPFLGAPKAQEEAEALVLDLKVRLHQKLLEALNLSAVEQLAKEQIVEQVRPIIHELLKEESAIPLNERERERMVTEVVDELTGLGPLEPLLHDPTISDIIVNTHAQVHAERRGRLEITPVRFKDDAHLMRIINKIVAAVGRRVDEGSPIVDARLGDGSRINAVIPPIAVDGPLLSIRKFAKMPYDLARLIGVGSITPEIKMLLEAMVRGKLNVLVSGGTGSGKTTLLNAMSRSIDPRDSVVTIEDAAELQLQQPLVRRMETRPSNAEGKGEITQRDLVKAALRMRPDRIILGEVRAGEAFDMLQAMNTGHEGSMSTIHANAPRDAVSRLEQMIGMAGFDMAPRSIRNQIASAIHVVLQLARWSDGKRRLISVQEITGMEGDVVTMNEIFKFVRTATDESGQITGHFEATGIRPRFAEELERRGIKLAHDMFAPNRRLA